MAHLFWRLCFAPGRGKRDRKAGAAFHAALFAFSALIAGVGYFAVVQIADEIAGILAHLQIAAFCAAIGVIAGSAFVLWAMKQLRILRLLIHLRKES